MKINFIIPMTHHTGGIQVIFTYAQKFLEHGHDVICYYPKIAYECENMGKRIKTTIGNFVKNRSEVDFGEYGFRIEGKILIRDTTIRDADVTIATSYQTAYDVNRLSKNKGKKFYFIQDHEIWYNKKACEKTYAYDLKKIVIAKWLDELLVNQYHCEHSKIIYNGIDTDQFYVSNKEWNHEGKINFLMLSNWRTSKNCEMGISIFEKIKSKYPDAVFRMFGITKDKRIPDFVKFYQNPSKKKLKELYAKSDIFLFPSTFEGWGLTVIEAMLGGCAVAGCQVGCLKEIAEHQVNAMLSQPKNQKELENHVEKLIENPKLMKKIALEGQKTAMQFKWENSVNTFLGYLKDENQ